jgi:hypothetical protein
MPVHHLPHFSVLLPRDPLPPSHFDDIVLLVTKSVTPQVEGYFRQDKHSQHFTAA